MARILHNAKLFLYETALRPSRENRRFQFLREYQRSQYLRIDEIRQLQVSRLKQLLQHATQNCQFYRLRVDESGFDPSEPDVLEAFPLIPPTTKADIQSHFVEMIASQWPKHDLIENFTGGSTGEPLKLFYDRTRHESRSAATVRHDSWAGRSIGDRMAFFWGAPTDLPRPSLKSRVRRWFDGPSLWLDTGNLKIEEFSEFNRQLIEFRPTIIIAYANSLALFARYLSENQLATCIPNAIITSAEILTDEGRALIESTFKCRVFNRYGCREVSVIASECEQHDGLHTMAEGLYVEVVDSRGQPVPAGETGDILVTDLLNYGMPLIRYRIGDRGSWASGECPCGRGLPRLREVAGRVTDFIVGADGRLVSGVFLATYVISKRPSLGRVQIIQSRLGEVKLRVQPGPSFDLVQDREYLFTGMRKHLGNLAMDLQLVPEILPEASGKLLFTKSTVAQNLTTVPTSESADF